MPEMVNRFLHGRRNSSVVATVVACLGASILDASQGRTSGDSISDSNSLANGINRIAPESLLPPSPTWHGKSAVHVVPPDDPWVTPFEASGLRRTPRYDETVDWLERLADAAPEVQLLSLGKSPEGRDIWMVVASADLAFSPEAMRRSGKPTLLVQAGIHAGEIDGKDAGLMLLRDLTVRGTQNELLQRVNLLFIPILNVDGHERFGPYSRINQRGPEELGWRTTARNLNLNRDYTKLDTPEMQHLVRALNTWEPDLYLDVHVTDGADYQYDITWGANGGAYSPEIGTWLNDELGRQLEKDLRDMGHIPGPLIFAVDERDISRGIVFWTASPRFSNGYGDARHLPTVLVENHSLKSYDQRVLGTYVLLESTLRTLARRGEALRRAIAADRARRAKQVPLDWIIGGAEPPTIEFLGIESHLTPSSTSGGLRLEWTGKPMRQRIPYLQRTEPVQVTTRPAAYWVPAAWSEIIERLIMHGVEVEILAEARTVDVEMYRFEDWKLETDVFEGHVRVTPGSKSLERQQMVWMPGSARISTDQPLGELLMLLLEPDSPDSFFQWGFFLEVLQRTEYAEAYVLETLASRMLGEDPELGAEFQRKLLDDSEFASSASERLDWFYQRSPFFDKRWCLYPIARE